jgi:hypothetical protein
MISDAALAALYAGLWYVVKPLGYKTWRVRRKNSLGGFEEQSVGYKTARKAQNQADRLNAKEASCDSAPPEKS